MRRLASVLLAAAVSASAAEPAQSGARSAAENARAAASAALGKPAAQPKQPSPEEVLRLEHNKLLNDLLVALSEHGDMCDEAMAAVAKLEPKQQKYAHDAIRAFMAAVPDTMDGAKPEAVKSAKLEAVLRIVAGAMRLQNGVPAETAFGSPAKPAAGN